MGKQHDTDKAIRNLLKWSDRPEWLEAKMSIFDDHLIPVSEHLNFHPDDLGQELADAGYWDMLYGVMLEDFFSCRFDPEDDNVIDDYLEHRGWRESVRGRRYLEQLRDSVLSLYEVVEVSPGNHCDIKDVIREGKTVRVYERMGTQNLVKWDRLAARVIKLDGKNYFTGGILPLEYDASNLLIEHLEQLRPKLARKLKKRAQKETSEKSVSASDINTQLLRESCPIFTQAWIANVLDALHKPLPDLYNTSGDELSFTDTHFPYQPANRDSIIQRLQNSIDWVRNDEEGLHWVWLPGDKADTNGNKSSGFAIETFHGGEAAVYGALVVSPQRLTFTTNSLERAEQGKELLQAMLENLVGEPLTKIETPEQFMANIEEHAMKDSGQGSLNPIDPDIEKEIIQKTLDTHYRKCLDDKIPALDNKTPRQCVKSKAGRKKVIEWLKYAENQEQRRASSKNMEPYDFSWMWRELGIRREETPCT